jgi:tetratricopeptide (TPR) repeat protein
MKKSIVVLMVVFAILAVAQQPPQQPAAPGQQPAGAQPAPGQQPAAPGQPAAPAAAQKKEIKDPAEYNAYMGALNTADANQKAIALEGFLQQFPNSVMKPDALELLMAAYEQAGNAQKVTETAQRLLQSDPNNLKALALMTYTARAQAEANPQTAAQNLAQAGQYAQQGLQAVQTAQKPEGMNDADWQKLKTQVAVIFNGAAGQNDFAQKNYPAAVQHLGAAVEADPNNLRNVYPLALAYLESNPPNPLGLWYIARAVALTAQAPAQSQQIARFGRSRYVKYHGGDDGWNEVVQQAAATPQPPAGFTIKPAPTPAEQAATLVQQKKVADMSFDEIQMVLTSGNQQAADQVWNDLKGKPTKFVAKVVEATPTKLTLSATADDIEKNAADVDLTMTAAVPARLVPKPGAMVPVQGTPVSYTPNPFMITMSSGVLGASEKPAAAAPATKKAPARKTTKKP